MLHRRAWFAEAQDFLLYDVMTSSGRVDEDVFAYSNGSGPERSLVVYHGRYGSTSGWIRDSTPYARRGADGAKRKVRRRLAEGLGIPDDPGVFVAFRDARSGLESLRSAHELWQRGLYVSLDAYGTHVYWEFREIHDGTAGQWARLAARLGERPVPSLDDALRELQLEPVHAPLRAIFADGLAGRVLDGKASTATFDELEGRFASFLTAIADATAVSGDPATVAAAVRRRVETALAAADLPASRVDRAALLAWLALSRTGELAPAADRAATSRAWYDELRLSSALAAGLREAGLDEGEAWTVADQVRVLLALPRPSELRGPARTADARLLDRWLAGDVVRTAIGLNTWEGVEWLDRDRFEAQLAWARRLDAIDAGPRRTSTDAPDATSRLAAAAKSAGYRLDKLMAALRRTGARPAVTARPRKVAPRPKARSKPAE